MEEDDVLLKHEVLHTAHIVEDMIARFLLEHPAVIGDDKLKKAANALHQQAYDFYQMAGE